MAASGISPYDSWKKMRKLTFLPSLRKKPMKSCVKLKS